MAKIKPYRICDICGRKYDKKTNVIKLKIYHEPEYLDDHGYWTSMDICADCGTDLHNLVIQRRRRDSMGY